MLAAIAPALHSLANHPWLTVLAVVVAAVVVAAAFALWVLHCLRCYD